ncbi:MAG: hypothetical protein AB7F09_17945 [Parvibaculaceae bacterium]
MWKCGIAALILLLGVSRGEVQAADSLECVKTQCEGRGKTCVEALYAAHDACMKAGNKKCSGVQPAEKFNCLKAELTPCALARNDRQASCLADMSSCHASCGPFDGGLTAYWCVGEFGNAVTAAFCAADMAAERPMDQCEKALGSAGPVSMTCDSL